LPELPEVERGRKIAEHALLGKIIERVTTVDDRIVYAGVTSARFAKALRGRRVDAVMRHGKQLWFELDRRPWPMFHFGMTGSFRTYTDIKDRPRFWKVELLAEDGTRLAMPNARRLGRIRLLDDPVNEKPVCDLGPDPYLALPSVKQLGETLARRDAPIKAILLDQGFLAGVGNWIADEVLYQAKIDPRRRGAQLIVEDIKRLHAKIRSVIGKAVAVDADKDRFPRSWLFHVRWGKDALARTSRGEKVVHATIGGRTTAWVPDVQR